MEQIGKLVSKYLLYTAALYCLFIIFSCEEEVAPQVENGLATVQVIDDYSNILPGIQIVMHKKEENGSSQIASTESDGSGEVQFDMLTLGEYSISAESAEWYSTPLNFKVEEGESINLNFILAKSYSKLKFLSYNVLRGFDNTEAKKNVFESWVRSKSPDIICYQELNYFTQQSFKEFALKLGHPYAVLLKESGYPTGISSIYPIINIERIESGLVHGYIYARVKDVHIFALHLSPTTLDSRLMEIDIIKNHLDRLPDDAKIILAGDFNSYSKLDQNAYGSDFENDMIARNPNTPVNFTVTNTLLDAGYKDTYFMFNTQFKRSLPTVKFLKQGDKGCRYDYIFLSHELSKDCISSDIIHDNVTDTLSDHYPVWAKFMEDNNQ